MSISKAAILIILSSVLVGCGGASKDDVPDLTFDIVNSVTINENEKAIIPLNEVEPNTSDVDYLVTFSEEINELEYNIENGEITFTLGDLLSEYKVTAFVKASINSEGLSYSDEFQLNLNNSSFEKIEGWLDSDAVYEFSDFDKLANFYAKTAFFHSLISIAEYKKYTTEFSSLLANVKNNQGSYDTSSFIESVGQYYQKQVTESEVALELTEYKLSVLSEYEQLANKLNEMANVLGGKLPTISTDKFEYLPQYGSFSGIVGDPLLGDFTDGRWVFGGKNKVLENLLPILGSVECDAISNEVQG